MKLIVITPERPVSNETETINKLFACGLQCLHVRKPGFTTVGYRDYISHIDTAHHKDIVIHGCCELYHSMHLGGVHLSSHARADNRIMQQTDNIPATALSSSFHTWQEVIDERRMYNYVFISPVFNSISKVGYNAAIDLEGAKDTRAKLEHASRHCPMLIGLGGVGAAQLPVLQEYGFDGGAMLGSIWQSANPVAEFMKANNVARPMR